MKLLSLTAVVLALCATSAWGQGYFGGGAPGGLSGGTNHAFPSSGVPSCAWSIAGSKCKADPQLARRPKKSATKRD